VFDFDAELSRYRPLFRAAYGIGPGDRVLDIGCGAGQSTLDAARVAVGGRALGVDLSEPALELARRRGREEGVDNVTFERADAQTHPFPANGFDVAISRFGTMFFADPVAAFTNIARAVRPGGRLVMLVWQDIALQEWVAVIRRCLAAEPPGPPAPPPDGSPFSLADPDTVRGILGAAGFTAVHHTDLREPVYYGPDAGAAAAAVLELRMATDLLAGRADADRERAVDRLRAELTARQTGDGVRFASRVWLVTAERG
jgi:SAM-dependent methyltransferase